MSNRIATEQAEFAADAERHVRLPRLLLVGGEDHALRIPFLIDLRARGFAVAAAGTGDPGGFLENGISYFPYHFDRMPNPLADWRSLRQLKRIIRKVQPDVVHAFDTKPGILVPLAARHCSQTQVVRTINGLGWLFSSNTPLAQALRPVFNLLHRVTAPLTSLTVFQNRSDQAFFQRAHMIGSGGSLLIPGSGVDPDRFAKALDDGPSSLELRNALGLSNDEVVITVARLSRLKGIPVLLEAAALVNQQRPNVRFLLVGSRETEGKFAVAQGEIDRHAPYVKALGQRADVPALLRMSNVFAFPTALYEGVPRALLEAALAGVPIVTTDMPGCADVVQDGASGYVVRSGDPQQLADRIICLLRNQAAARAMADRAQTHVRSAFNLDLIVRRYEDAYRQLMDIGQTA